MAKARSAAVREVEREVELGGRTHRYTVRVSRRARRVSIQVRPGRILVVLPRGVEVSRADDLLKAKADWVTRKLEEFALLESQAQLLDERGQPRLLHFGRWLSLDVTRSKGGAAPVVWVQNGRLRFLWPEGKPLDPDRLARELERWYRLRAREFLGAMLAETAAEMGLETPVLTIRGQKTVWGSYSARSGVSLNWKLLMAPEGAIRSVVVHELSHVLVRNHSPRFWAVVERYCPNYRQHRQWLNAQGHLVQRLATFAHVQEAWSDFRRT